MYYKWPEYTGDCHSCSFEKFILKNQENCAKRKQRGYLYWTRNNNKRIILCHDNAVKLKRNIAVGFRSHMFCLFVCLFTFTSFLEKEGLMFSTYSQTNLLVPLIQTSLFRDFYHYAFLCCTCITANSSFKYLSDPQLALIFTRYKKRVFSTDGSL